MDKIFDKKKLEKRQELARLFAKDAFEQLHYWEPNTKEEKAAKALAHAVVAETSARIAGNPTGSGFYAGETNEALIGKIHKIAKSNPAVAQWLSASLGALVNHGSGKSPNTGVTEAQNATKNNAYGVMLKNKELSEDDYSLPGKFSAGAGLFINNTIGEYTDNTTKKIKEYIKEKEDEWKNK